MLIIRQFWRWVVLAVISSGVLLAQDTKPDLDDAACTKLLQVKDATSRVTLAQAIHAPLTVGSGRSAVTVSQAFCRVVGTVAPVAGSEIQFELWLPPQANWNGKFAGVGSGGSLGTIEYKSLSRMLARGYATVATDNGHRSEAYDVSWALHQPERIIDFGYRAEHTVTLVGKKLAQTFYGRGPQHSYFIGCSQGGHHAFTEAQRFPEDYDGIVAGAPVYSWTKEMTEQAWNVRALRELPDGALRKEKLAILYEGVYKACAGTDGLIDDPRNCSFDPAAIQCKMADSPSCLTAAEVSAVRKMYEGPKTSDGRQIHPGLTRGSESQWDLLWSDSKHLGGSWEGFFRYMIFDDPAWELAKLNFDSDPVLAKQKLGLTMDPDNPDLGAFASRGGKLIVYHGWADNMVPAKTSIDFWQSVNSKMGDSHVSDFYRLFMIPGMSHCGDGPGANILFHSEDAITVPLEPERDMLSALEHWVEQSHAPSKFVVSRVNEGGIVERTRLVCPYPSQAKYRGQGNVEQADNFTCARPLKRTKGCLVSASLGRGFFSYQS